MTLLALLGLMGVASASTFWAKGNWYVLLAVLWTGIFIWFGRSVADLTWADMGMHRWISGALWGGVCILAVSVAMALGVAIPRLQPLFGDARLQDKTGLQVAHKSLIEVPLGTVLLEEVIFRGVLMGLLTVQYGWIWGIVGSSIVFGFWHVLPALEMHGNHVLTKRNGATWRAKLTTVAATVVATGLAGLTFALLRLGSGSILAPMGHHWATNSTGSVATWLVGRRVRRREARARHERPSEAGPEPESPEG